jgi:hypothetical protein
MSYKRYILITFILIPFAMLSIYIISLELLQKDWIRSEARIEQTTIKHTRPGTPAWSLIAEISYQLKNQSYTHKGLEIFRDKARQITKAEQANWPEGKVIIIYINPDNPNSVSLASDGDRQALAILAAILTPMAMIILGLIFLLIKRLRGKS